MEDRYNVGTKLAVIIDGERVELELMSYRDEIELHDVTPVGVRWRNFVPANETRIELHGTTPDGKEVNGVFHVTGRLEDGTVIYSGPVKLDS